MKLTHIDHVALESKNISESVAWYSKQFDCKIKHQDSTWALLEFSNISIALVTPGDHPPHIAVVDENVINHPEAKVHRDGISYIYDTDPDLNAIEKIDRKPF